MRPYRTEIIVVANRCTDKTAEIAASYGAVFWFRKRDFLRIGGFDETLVSPEDMDFARRLNRLGRDRKAADSFYYHVR